MAYRSIGWSIQRSTRFGCYRRAGNRFDRAVELTTERGDVLTTPLLPGLEIVLTRIFDEPAGATPR